MRGTAPATTLLPYIAKWTSASEDLTATTADVAPLTLPGLAGQQFVNFCFAGDSASKTFTWQLILWDSKIGAVIRTIVFTTAATARRQALAGASGAYMHEDKIIDIGGVHSGGTSGGGREWALALYSIDTDTGAYLLDVSFAPLIRGG